MDNLILQKIKDLIDKNDKVGIAVGKNPTIDTMAAALSLYLGLQDYGKNPAVASGSQPLVEHSSLVGIDKVRGSFASGGETATASGDLVVSFPYREGEIEKVSYTIEGGYLNIVVKAGQQGLTFQESDVKFRRGGQAGGASGDAPSILFIVGTSRLSDLGQLFDTEALKNTAIVNIDNSTDNQGYGDVPAVSPDVASVSEMVAGLLYYLGIDVNEDIAQNLMYGINDGSNNMQDPRVSYSTFELVANLMKKGANRASQRAQQPRPNQSMPQAPQVQRPQQGLGNRYPGGQQGQYPRPQMPRQQVQRPGGYQQRPPMMPRNTMPDPYAALPSQFPGQPDPYAGGMPQPGNYSQGMPPMPRPGRSAGQQGQGFDQSRFGNVQGMDQGQFGGPDYTQTENMQPEVARRDAPQGPGNRDAGQRFGGGQRQNNQPRRDQGQQRKPPSDWLTPKVYKGSSDVE